MTYTVGEVKALSKVEDMGCTPRKIGWGCAARFPKPLPYLLGPIIFMTKNP